LGKASRISAQLVGTAREPHGGQIHDAGSRRNPAEGVEYEARRLRRSGRPADQSPGRDRFRYEVDDPSRLYGILTPMGAASLMEATPSRRSGSPISSSMRHWRLGLSTLALRSKRLM